MGFSVVLAAVAVLVAGLAVVLLVAVVTGLLVVVLAGRALGVEVVLLAGRALGVLAVFAGFAVVVGRLPEEVLGCREVWEEAEVLGFAVVVGREVCEVAGLLLTELFEGTRLAALCCAF